MDLGGFGGDEWGWGVLGGAEWGWGALGGDEGVWGVLGGVEGVICAAIPSSQATRNTGKSIANKNIANPTAALLAACMMLDHLR